MPFSDEAGYGLLIGGDTVGPTRRLYEAATVVAAAMSLSYS